MSHQAERMATWRAFLQRWPREGLDALTLESYTQNDAKACLSGWVKTQTDGLGWRPTGGTGRERIGICALPSSVREEVIETYRSKKTCRVDDQAAYLWTASLGNTPEQVFRVVKARVLHLSSAAARGDVDVLHEPVLHPDYEWKLFFLYQDPERPVILPVHNAEESTPSWYRPKLRRWLEPALREPLRRALQANQELMAARNRQPLFDYVNELEALSSAYDWVEDEQNGWPLRPNEHIQTMEQNVTYPLNQIFFGPPGTGKTFATVDAALAILDPAFAMANANDRLALKRRFDELTEERRIRFTTFHQSFSYEDFVEGIRASTPSEDDEEAPGISYAVKPGVFVSLCIDARRNRQLDATLGVRQDAKVWKLSIEEASGPGDTRNYCLAHDEARIGWPQTGDLNRANLEDPAFKLGSNERHSLRAFGHQILTGDVVLCLRSKTSIGAVGVVTGEYEYSPGQPGVPREDFVHRLPVRWLAKGLDFNILPINGGVQLTLKAVYHLWRIQWPDLMQALASAGIALASAEPATAEESEPYVLIIDEINRGNVSRIFGELITLIEPSKRAGAGEALAALLPYSQKPFSVPANVHLIGTMNTADRSLAGLDVALRRRFVFREMRPQAHLLDGVMVHEVSMGQLLRTLNERIEALLDREHCLGHAYFMPLKGLASAAAEAKLAEVFANQVLPLLQEYFFEDWERIQWVLNDHRKPDAHRFVQAKVLTASALFGVDVPISPNSKTWRVNATAFALAASYQGVIAAQASPDDQGGS